MADFTLTEAMMVVSDYASARAFLEGRPHRRLCRDTLLTHVPGGLTADQTHWIALSGIAVRYDDVDIVTYHLVDVLTLRAAGRTDVGLLRRLRAFSDLKIISLDGDLWILRDVPLLVTDGLIVDLAGQPVRVSASGTIEYRKRP